MTKIDPKDPQWQVCDEFKPDKEGTWPTPIEKDGWILAHNSIRAEMRMFREAFESIRQRGEGLKEWEIKAIQTAAQGHIEHIHSHHTNEDDICVPEIRKRYKYPEKLETDHDGLVKALDNLEGMINLLKQGDRIDELVKEWTAYEAMMLPHLQEEEHVALPLLRAYFTPQEFMVIVQKLIAKGPKTEMGSFIHSLGVDEFRNGFMKQEGIPFFVWYIDFKAKYNHFLEIFVRNIDALKEGVEPEGKTKADLLRTSVDVLVVASVVVVAVTLFTKFRK